MAASMLKMQHECRSITSCRICIALTFWRHHQCVVCVVCHTNDSFCLCVSSAARSWEHSIGCITKDHFAKWSTFLLFLMFLKHHVCVWGFAFSNVQSTNFKETDECESLFVCIWQHASAFLNDSPWFKGLLSFGVPSAPQMSSTWFGFDKHLKCAGIEPADHLHFRWESGQFAVKNPPSVSLEKNLFQMILRFIINQKVDCFCRFLVGKPVRFAGQDDSLTKWCAYFEK